MVLSLVMALSLHGEQPHFTDSREEISSLLMKVVSFASTVREIRSGLPTQVRELDRKLPNRTRQLFARSCGRFERIDLVRIKSLLPIPVETESFD